MVNKTISRIYALLKNIYIYPVPSAGECVLTNTHKIGHNFNNALESNSGGFLSAVYIFLDIYNEYALLFFHWKIKDVFKMNAVP